MLTEQQIVELSEGYTCPIGQVPTTPFESDMAKVYAEFARLILRMERESSGERTAMQELSNAQAEITRLRAELVQARAWSAAWKRRASYYRIRYKLASANRWKWVAHCGEVSSVAESALLYIQSELAQAHADIARLSGHLNGCDYATESFMQRLCEVLELDYEHGSGTDNVISAIGRLRADIARKDAALQEIYDCGSIRRAEQIARATLSPLHDEGKAA